MMMWTFTKSFTFVLCIETIVIATTTTIKELLTWLSFRIVIEIHFRATARTYFFRQLTRFKRFKKTIEIHIYAIIYLYYRKIPSFVLTWPAAASDSSPFTTFKDRTSRIQKHKIALKYFIFIVKRSTSDFRIYYQLNYLFYLKVI